MFFARTLHRFLINVPLLLSASLPATAEDLLFERLTIDDGLAHTSVWAMTQDHQGFLWIGSQGGLNRYDGYELRLFEKIPGDPKTLAENLVFVIREDRDQQLWVGTFGGGLDRFDRKTETFVHHRHDPADATSLSHNDILAILEDRQGRLWAGTENGLNLLQKRPGLENTTFVRFLKKDGQLGGRAVTTLAEAVDGRLWVGSWEGLSHFDPERASDSGVGLIRHYRHESNDPDSLVHDEIYAITSDGSGGLWVATTGGLDHFDPKTEVFSHVLSSEDDVLAGAVPLMVGLDRAGVLWVGTNTRGLLRRNPAGAFVHHRHDPADQRTLISDEVRSIFEDRSGVIWLGTMGGVSHYHPARQRFRTFRHRREDPTSLSHNEVSALYEDRSGNLWLGSVAGGLDRLDKQYRRTAHYEHDPEDPESLVDNTVRSILEDSSGNLWVGTWGGLSRWNPQTESFENFRHDPGDPASLPSDFVGKVFEDRKGRIWLGTYVGVYIFDVSTTSFEEPGLGKELPIYEILEGVRGDMWLGSDRGGVFHRAADTWTHYVHDPEDSSSLASDQIADLYEDCTGTVWIGTYGGGLNVFDPHNGRFESYLRRDGLADNTVLGILESDEGDLWLTTSRGVSRFDPSTKSFQNFGRDDGLQGLVFNKDAVWRTTYGDFLMGGSDGLNVFQPNLLRDDENLVAPKIVMTDFKLFNESVAPLGRGSPLRLPLNEAEEIVLNHSENFFSFRFAALQFTQPARNAYSYRLDGFDSDWRSTGSDERIATYTNVDPGDYTFRVRAANANGVWSEEDATIRVIVRPPFWKTWWAMTVYGLLLAASVAAYTRWHQQRLEDERARTRKEREINRELELRNEELGRFNYTVSHDLRTPLVTIKGYLGYVKKDLPPEIAEATASDFRHIEDATDNMRRLLDDLLELSRIGREDQPSTAVPFTELAQSAARLAAGILNERGVEVVIEDDMPVISGDRQRFLQMMQNLIENAVKYMGDQAQPRIEIGTRSDQAEHVILFVRDNGIGIPQEYQQKIFGLFDQLDPQAAGTGLGLALVRQVVEVHHGTVWVESDGPGTGSTFVILLPRWHQSSSK